MYRQITRASGRETMFVRDVLLLLGCVAVLTAHKHHLPVRHKGSSDTGDDEDLEFAGNHEVFHDEEHMEEDMGELYTKEQIKQMSKEEHYFHYFKNHDYDKNNKLDGLEMLKAVLHLLYDHEEDDADVGEDAEKVAEKRAKKEENHRLIERAKTFHISNIDKFLENGDANQDGFLTFPELMTAMKKNMEERQAERAM